MSSMPRDTCGTRAYAPWSSGCSSRRLTCSSRGPVVRSPPSPSSRRAARRRRRHDTPRQPARGEWRHPPSFLRAAHTLLRALLKQCALIDLLEHAQAHLPAHLVILLQVPYSIHRGFFLSAAVWILSLHYVRKAPPLSPLPLI